MNLRAICGYGSRRRARHDGIGSDGPIIGGDRRSSRRIDPVAFLGPDVMMSVPPAIVMPLVMIVMMMPVVVRGLVVLGCRRMSLSDRAGRVGPIGLGLRFASFRLVGVVLFRRHLGLGERLERRLRLRFCSRLRSRFRGGMRGRFAAGVFRSFMTGFDRVRAAPMSSMTAEA